ncbi:phage tail protein [Paenibacillus sp. WLX2291]|uniref:phage tail protein n=1 Tax=Paenibacillus sp. WLX2291 TaxID=3296934 RepID=UPI0039843310
MASNTPNLNLLKKNPATDGNDTFNVQTMLNDNWDKIDTAVKQVKDKVDTINVPPASTTQAGIVQLTNATNSTSETLAPTAKALKTVSDAALPKTGGTVSGTLSISDPNTTPLMIHSPGSKRWVSHLETPANSSTTGGRLHLAPSKSVDATDWDFDKGIMINSDTGRVKVKNGVEGDFVTYNRTWLNAQTNLGTTPSYTLTLGDSDTGFNWNGDGYFDIKSNGSTAAYVNNGKFVVRDDGNNYYDVGNDIRDLKSSGVNYKNQLAAQLNAKNVSAAGSEDFSALVNKVGNIRAIAREVRGSAPGLTNSGYITRGSNTTQDFVFSLENFPYNLASGHISLTGVKVYDTNGNYVFDGGTAWISSWGDQYILSTSVGVYFTVVGIGYSTITVRVYINTSSFREVRFNATNVRAIGI